ncbi:MAG TPA: glycosyltransferase family 2 protein [Myxococcota bacterium]|nr:glycosyltransferase family 2 protein [Myxococcota bacterium]
MTAPRLSVCIIACNEERNLGRCLDSVSFADEIVVVVDGRSADATESIARARGCRVLVHPYAGNVAQKNVALDQARGEWVLALDADEGASPGLAAEIRRLLEGAPAEDGYELNRLTWHLGRWIRHGDFFPDWQLRLFRRARGRWAGIDPHGRVALEGSVGRLLEPLHHWSYRDLADQVERIQEFSRVQAGALRAEGRRARLSDLLLRPPARFLRAYLLKAGFLDGVPGLVIAAATAFHVFLKYAKLWELDALPPGSDAPEGAAGKARLSSARPGASDTSR